MSLPDFDSTKPKTEQGIYRKYHVSRVDGSDQPGGKHESSDYFVLDLTHDHYARAAAMVYAMLCRDEFPALAAELAEKGQELQLSMTMADLFMVAKYHVAEGEPALTFMEFVPSLMDGLSDEQLTSTTVLIPVSLQSLTQVEQPE
jgi:hypothetical protein